MFTNKRFIVMTLYVLISILSFHYGTQFDLFGGEEEEPWRCQSLAEGAYGYMGTMVDSDLTQIVDEPLWTFKWDRNYPAVVVSATLAEALRIQGALVQNDSIHSEYLPDGSYFIISNYKINGTTCNVSLTLGSRNVWVSHGPHNAK